MSNKQNDIILENQQEFKSVRIRTSITLSREELRRLDLACKRADRPRSYLIGKWALTLPKD